jgi:acyl carrier protein
VNDVSDASDALRRALAGLVAPLLSPPVDPGALRDDTPLLDGAPGLDSVALLELVVRLEERLAVVVGSEDVGPGHFGTFGSLLAFVARRRA